MAAMKQYQPDTSVVAVRTAATATAH